MFSQDWEPTVLRKSAAERKKTAEAEGKARGEVKVKTVVSEQTARLFEASQAEGPAPVPSPPRSLQTTIQEKRVAKGWNRKTLALQAGVKEQVVEAYETGKGVVNPGELAKIGKALGVDLRPFAKSPKKAEWSDFKI